MSRAIGPLPRVPGPAPEPQIDMEDWKRRQAQAKSPQALAIMRARNLLDATDYVVTKAAEGRKLSADWIAWRNVLRSVVRGEGLDIPPEPERWAVGDEPADLRAQLDAGKADEFLFPAPDERLGDYDALEAERQIKPQDLLDMLPKGDEAVSDVVGKLTKGARKRFTELLNVELAELQQDRGGPREDRKREAMIERLLGVFARVGEM